MRITVHLDMFDHVDPCGYAILWLDDVSLKWSREGHLGLTLPEWGRLRVDAKNTLICGPLGTRPLCVLKGLELGKHGAPFEGEVGRTHWYASGHAQPEPGHWHVQCVDEACIHPENSVFADDGAA